MPSEGVTSKLAGAFRPCESTAVLSTLCAVVTIRARFPRIASTDIRVGEIREKERERELLRFECARDFNS